VHLWFLFLEHIPCEWFLFNQISLLFRCSVYICLVCNNYSIASTYNLAFNFSSFWNNLHANNSSQIKSHHISGEPCIYLTSFYHFFILSSIPIFQLRTCNMKIMSTKCIQLLKATFIHLFLLVKIPIQCHMTQDKDNSCITIIQEARIQQNETDVKIYYVTACAFPLFFGGEGVDTFNKDVH
jgi:hypothetical protein